MRFYKSLVLGIVLLLFCCDGIAAASDLDSLVIWFRVGQSAYDPSYKDNSKRLDEFLDRQEESYRNSSLMRIKSIELYATSSLEGKSASNNRLSKARISSMEKVLHARAGFLESGDVVEVAGEDWDGIVTKLQQSTQPWKEDVLEIIGQEGKDSDSIKKDLMAYDGGKAWKYMMHNWFPDLRRFVIILRKELDLSELPELPDPVIDDIPITCIEDTIFLSPTELYVAPMEYRRSHFNLVLKTNGLGWLMLHGNAAVEMDFAPHFSLALPFYYSGGLDYFTSDLKFRGIVFQPELRYYFKDNDGWYIGAHFGMGWYNFAINGRYRIQDSDKRPALGGGLGAGYQYSFSKVPGLGLEFGIGAGVYHAVYDKFYNEPNGAYAARRQNKTFIGIDNIAVSVTYDFGKTGKEGRK